MRNGFVFVLILFVLLLTAAPAFSLTPSLRVYFDAAFTETHRDCPDDPPGTVEGYLYIVAEDFNIWMNAIEYKIAYPPEIAFIEDQSLGLDIGTSAIGISSAWPIYLLSYEPVLVNKVKFTWMCQGTQSEPIPIQIVPHPETGFIRAVGWTLDFVYAVGFSGWIRPTEVPVEETSWGQIKALYRE